MTGLDGDDGPRETCEFCGFDSALYGRADTVSSQRPIAPILGSAIEGLSTEVLDRRPDPETWSIGEYVDHIREVAFAIRFVMEAALAEPGVDLGDPPDMGLVPEVRIIDVRGALQRVADEFESIHDLLRGLDDEQWGRTAVIGGEIRTIGWLARHVLHDAFHHLADIGRIRQQFGFGASPDRGTVAGIHTSGGGVPKLPVESAAIGPSGVEGDSQDDRLHHGRPIQAVCLWSADVIAELQTEGHPIVAGAAGENVTIAGVTWAEIRPGTILQVSAIPMLVTAFAIPCGKNAQWFQDRNVNRILHDDHPGWSRVYAIALGSGEVRPGDPVLVEP